MDEYKQYIVGLKLSSGEDIMGLNKGSYTLDKPVVIHITQEGFAMIPWVPYIKDGHFISIRSEHIVAEYEPSEPFKQSYYEQFHSKIKIPQQSGILLPGTQ